MHLPLTVEDPDGRTLTVRRTWPHDDGRLTLEAVDAGGRLRAGIIGEDGRVRMSRYAEDPSLPGLTTAAGAGELLVHRYRRRAVIRADGVFLKVLPLHKATDVADRHQVAARLAGAADIAVPNVLGLDGGTLSLSVVEGTSLHDAGRADAAAPEVTVHTVDTADTAHGSGHHRGTVQEAWDSWADRWPAFVRAADGTAVGGSPAVASHGPEDEARTLGTWVARCIRFGALPVEPSALEAAAARARASLLGGTPQRAGLAHRDLHDKQLFVRPARAGSPSAVGLIDCDTLALAEPALDLANLLVHLEFREAQGLLGAASRASGEEAVLAVAAQLAVPLDRLAAYAQSTRLRLACVYAFRPRWQELALDWARSV